MENSEIGHRFYQWEIKVCSSLFKCCYGFLLSVLFLFVHHMIVMILINKSNSQSKIAYVGCFPETSLLHCVISVLHARFIKDITHRSPYQTLFQRANINSFKQTKTIFLTRIRFYSASVSLFFQWETIQKRIVFLCLTKSRN